METQKTDLEYWINYLREKTTAVGHIPVKIRELIASLLEAYSKDIEYKKELLKDKQKLEDLREHLKAEEVVINDSTREFKEYTENQKLEMEKLQEKVDQLKKCRNLALEFIHTNKHGFYGFLTLDKGLKISKEEYENMLKYLTPEILDNIDVNIEDLLIQEAIQGMCLLSLEEKK